LGGYAKRQRTQPLTLDAVPPESSKRGLHNAPVPRADTAVGNLHYHFGSRAQLRRATMYDAEKLAEFATGQAPA